MAAHRIVPCIWLDDQAEAAASFCLAAFPEGHVAAGDVRRPGRGRPRRDRVFHALLPMRRLDVMALERAFEGG